MIKFVAAALLSTGLLASGVASAMTLADAVRAAESQFGGEAFEAEIYRENRRDYIEVEVLSGGEIYEVEFDAADGRLIDWERYNQPRLARQVAAALQRARTTLVGAIEAAQRAKGPGQVFDAEILLSRNASRNGGRYEVYIRTSDGVFEVIINAQNGRVIRVDRD